MDRETKSSYNLIVTARDCAKEFPMMYDDHNEYDDDVTAAIDSSEVRVNQYKSMPYNLQRQRRQYLQYQQQLQLQQLQQQQQQQQYGGIVQEPQQRLSSTVQVSL